MGPGVKTLLQSPYIPRLPEKEGVKKGGQVMVPEVSRPHKSRFLLLILAIFIATIFPPSPLNGAMASPNDGPEGLQDLPPPYTVEMPYNSLVLDVSYSEGDSVAMFPGSVTTNYPGLTITFSIIASLGTFNNTVEPASFTVRGIDTINFTINVSIPYDVPDNTSAMGQVHITAIIQYPGMTHTSTSAGSLSLEVHNEARRPVPTEYTDPADLRTDSTLNEDGGMGLRPFVLLIAVIVIAVVVMVKRKGKRGRKRSSKRRK